MKEKLRQLLQARKGFDSLTELECKELQLEVVTFFNRGNTLVKTYKEFNISRDYCRELIVTSGNKTALKYLKTRKRTVCEWVEDTSREFSKLILTEKDFENDILTKLY